MKKNIALIAGGFSGEYDVSIRSADVVEKNIDKNLYDVHKIIIDKNKWFSAEDENVQIDKNDFSLTLNGKNIKFDCAFIIIHGTPGEDGKLQSYLDMLNIPFTTCDSITSALTFNKAFCNKIVQSSTNIVAVAKSLHLFSKGDYSIDFIAGEIGFPCFVKPNAGGSSIGMSKVSHENDLKNAIIKAFKEDSQVLIEEFIKGREFTCGVFKRKDNSVLAFPVTEVVSKKEFFDYEAKYNPALSNEITPADISEHLTKKIQQTAVALYKILHCNGICRFDFIYEETKQQIYFLEVNTVPGQSEQSIVPQQISAAGYKISDIYAELIESVL